MNSLYSIISELCAERGIKPGRMCNELGISRSAISDLKMGRKDSFSSGTLAKIAAYFNVSVDYLLGTETKNAPADDGEGEEDETMLILSRNAKKLTPEDRKKLNEILKTVFEGEFED